MSTKKPLVVMLAAALVAASAVAQDARPAADIIRKFRSVSFPSVSSGSDDAARAAFRRELERAAGRQCALALELFEGHPTDPEVPDLLDKRWALLVNTLHEPKRVFDETWPLLDRDDGDPLRTVALQARAWAALQSPAMPTADKLAHVQRALDADPGAQRCGLYVLELLQTEPLDPEAMRALAESTLESWPDDPWVARPAKGLIAQLDRIGKPLPFSPQDVLGKSAPPGHTVAIYWSWPSEKVADALRTTQAWTERFAGLRAVGVVNFALDGGEQRLAEQLASWQVDMPQHYDAERIGDTLLPTYATPRTPFWYLLDPDGNVLRFAYDAATMERILAQTLEAAR